MELRHFWPAVRRRLWIALALTVITLLASVIITLRQGIAYQATTTFVMGVNPDPSQGDFYKYEGIYTFQAGEYILDDFSEIIRSDQFTKDIRAELGDDVKFDKIIGERLTRRTHRLMKISVTAPDKEDARLVANAVARVIEKNQTKYLDQLNEHRAVIHVIDPANIELAVPPLRLILDFLLRGLLAFVLGLGIILLLEYLDTSVRDRDDAEQRLGLPVLGEIPAG